MSKKLVFVDIDGTLLDFNSQLPASAARAIAIARDNGHRVYIATGRCKPEIYTDVLEIGFDGVVASSGAHVETDGTIISGKYVPVDVLKRSIDYFQQHNIEFSLEGAHEVLMSPDYINRMRIITGGAIGDNMLGRLAATMRVADNYIVDDINKMCIITPADVDMEDIIDKLGAYFDFDGSSISVEANGFCELTMKGIDKAYGIKVLEQYYGINHDCTIAIGDSSNDRAMLAYAGCSVAMGNANDSIKAIANYVTAHVNDDGLYKAFRHLELI